MRKITLIGIEWNYWNGFVFDFISIETDHFDGQLFSIYASKDYFEFSMFFIKFIVKSPL